MQSIQVRTTQNVHIHYPLASVGDRILAYIVDTFLLFFTSLVLILTIRNIQEWILIILLGFPWLFYRVLFEIFMNGQTPGKRLFDIKVMRINGTPATVGDYLLRWIFGFVDLYILGGVIALLCVTIGGKGQRLGDMVAGTTVVKLKEQREVKASEIFVSPDASHQPLFPEVIQLNPEDIELIQRALEVNREHGNTKPVLAITEKIKTRLGIQTDLPPVKFLYGIVKDYHHLTAR